MNKKYIPSIFFIITAIVIYIVSIYLKVDAICGWFTFVNPACWWNIVVSFLTTSLIIGFIILAILFLFITEKQHRYFILFFVFGIIAIFNWLTPDIIPFIDEIIFTGISLISFFKSVQR